MARGDELFERIRQEPDNADAYLVYADQLTADDDPQGELIVLMHQLEQATSDDQRAYLGNALAALQTKHHKAVFGNLAKHQGIGWDFRWGFLRGVTVMPHVSAVKTILRQILALPIARVLRELRVFDRWRTNRTGLEKAVADCKPPTLDDIEFPRCFTSVDEALEARRGGERVRWLHLQGDFEAVPGGIDQLVELEWLEISSLRLLDLPPGLADLPRLRRLDIDQCYLLQSFPDDVLAIDTLSYVSMYDCPSLPDRLHMGKINTLLAGFARTYAPRRRREIEVNLMLERDVRAGKLATVADLLAALDSNVGTVREAALRLLAYKVAAPKLPERGGSFALLGKANFDKQQLTDKLAERGAKLTTKIDKSTTHVILGLAPGGKQQAIGDRPIILEPHLRDWITTTAEESPARSADDLERIRAGLRSKDEAQTAAAVNAIRDSAYDPSLLLDLVLVAQDTKLKKARDGAKKLIAIHAPAVDAAIKQHLKQSLLLASMGEGNRMLRIMAFAGDAGPVGGRSSSDRIDGLELAHLLVERARVGLAYVFCYGKPADHARALRAAAVHTGVPGKLDLSVAELDGVPDELCDLDEITDLVLAQNHLRTIPEAVLAMRSLRRLDLASNKLGKLPDKLARLPLTALSVRYNWLRTFPEVVTRMPTLEELDLTSETRYIEDEARIRGIPDDIGKLVNLRVLQFRFNIIDKFPAALWTLPLEELDLGWCDLPAEIPVELMKLSRLKTLGVRYTRWKERLDELAAMLPGVQIDA